MLKGCLLNCPFLSLVLGSCCLLLMLAGGGVSGSWLHKSWCVFFFLLERSQDSMAIVLSDCSSTQDTFMEPASSQDSSKGLYMEKKSSYSHNTSHYRDVQLAADDKGNLL